MCTIQLYPYNFELSSNIDSSISTATLSRLSEADFQYIFQQFLLFMENGIFNQAIPSKADCSRQYSIPTAMVTLKNQLK